MHIFRDAIYFVYRPSGNCLTRRLSNYFLPRPIKTRPLFRRARDRNDEIPIRRNFSRPSFVPLEVGSGRATTFANSKLLGASPGTRAKVPPHPTPSRPVLVKDPSCPIPIPFPPDGLSFPSRRRSYAKSYFSPTRKRKAFGCK